MCPSQYSFFPRSEIFPFKNTKKMGARRLDCNSCGLYKDCKSPKMEMYGKGKQEVMIIGEAPGAKEDEQGRPFVGESGRLLRKYFKDVLELDIDKDCWTINAIRCRPLNNRTPTNSEIACCRKYVEEDLERVSPKFIFLFGNVALQSYLNENQGVGITRWRGMAIPDQERGAWVISTYHPSFLLRSGKTPVVFKLFVDDLVLYWQKKHVPFPIYKYEVRTPKLLDVEEELKELGYKGGVMAFDYETTGLKPFTQGHRIVCASFCTNDKYSTAFTVPEKGSGLWNVWKSILGDERVGKTAHNMKFEHQWSRMFFGTSVKGWMWDSMIASHVLDNRRDFCGLKFQACVNFGLKDYSSHIEPYLTSDDSNGFNSIQEADKKELLTYCGMDSLVQYRLARKQMKEMA